MSEEQRYTYQVQLTPSEVECARDNIELDIGHHQQNPSGATSVKALRRVLNALDGPPVDEDKPKEQSTESMVAQFDVTFTCNTWAASAADAIEMALEQIGDESAYVEAVPTEADSPKPTDVERFVGLEGELRNLRVLDKEQSTSSEAPCTESFVPQVWMQLEANVLLDADEYTIHIDTGEGDPAMVVFGAAPEAMETYRALHNFLVNRRSSALATVIRHIHMGECRLPARDDERHKVRLIQELIDTYCRAHLED